MRASILFAIAALLAACSDDRVAGTGSQTGNSVVAGRILRSDAVTPAMGDSVQLRPASWTGDSSSPRIRVTDSLGRYRFEGVSPGLWTLESRGRQRGWKRTLRVSSERDTILPDGVRIAYGSLFVEVHLNDSLRRGTLIVLGRDTSYSLMTAARTMFVTIRDLSPGVHTLVVRSAGGSFLQQAIATVRSAAVDSVDFTAWSTKETDPAEDEPDGDADDD